MTMTPDDAAAVLRANLDGEKPEPNRKDCLVIVNCDHLATILDERERDKAKAEDWAHLSQQVDALAKVLLEEFGGPTQEESACEMAVRVLREQQHQRERDKAEIERLREALSELCDSILRGDAPYSVSSNARLMQDARLMQLALTDQMPVTLNPQEQEVGDA